MTNFLNQDENPVETPETTTETTETPAETEETTETPAEETPIQ